MSWTLPGSLKGPAEDLRASAKAEPDAHHETIDSIHPENRVHFLRAAVTHSEPGIPAKNNRSMSGSAIWNKPRSLGRSGHLGFDERNNNLIELIWFLQIH